MPDAPINLVIDACGELEYADLASLQPVVGNWGSLRTNVHFFESFDPFIFTWHSVVDAAHLANYVAEQSSKGGAAVSAESMAKRFNWAARRLNPPLMIVANYIAEARKFTGYAPPWACRHLYADPAERAALRHFAKGIIGE
jgi:hypothetical protein